MERGPTLAIERYSITAVEEQTFQDEYGRMNAEKVGRIQLSDVTNIPGSFLGG
jgi:hypothetical protein